MAAILMWLALFSKNVSAIDWNEQTCPASTNGIANLKELNQASFEILKNTQVNSAKHNMAGFCKSVLLNRYMNTKNIPIERRLNKSVSELEKEADKIKFEVPEGDETWNLTLISTKKSRQAAFNIAAHNNDDHLKDDKSDEPVKVDTKEQYGDRLITSQMDLFETAACAREEILKTFACKKALEEISKIGKPSTENSKRMTPDAWKAIYEKVEYDKGLSIAASALREIVTHPEGNLRSDTNVYDFLQKSFLKSGMPLDKALRATWDTLGAIANAGPSTNFRARSISDGVKTSNLNMIANAMGMLDYLKQERGWPLFSYPKTINSSCDSAKPYHFWMSAYLGRKLAQDQNLSREDVTKYVVLSEKGYQANRELGRPFSSSGHLSTMLKREDFDPAQQVIRMDLAYSAAGAAFGAESTSKIPAEHPYDVNKTIVNLIESSGKTMSEGDETFNQLEKLKNFETVFRPDVAITSVLRN